MSIFSKTLKLESIWYWAKIIGSPGRKLENLRGELVSQMKGFGFKETGNVKNYAEFVKSYFRGADTNHPYFQKVLFSINYVNPINIPSDIKILAGITGIEPSRVIVIETNDQSFKKKMLISLENFNDNSGLIYVNNFRNLDNQREQIRYYYFSASMNSNLVEVREINGYKGSQDISNTKIVIVLCVDDPKAKSPSVPTEDFIKLGIID